MRSLKPPGRLVFVDCAGDARSERMEELAGPGTLVVALTADATDALREREVPHRPVSEFADPRKLLPLEPRMTRAAVDIARALELAVAQSYAPARFEGPGFLAASLHQLQHTLVAIATRAVLMSEAIGELRPREVAAFARPAEAWLAPDGYVRNPWLDPLRELSGTLGFGLEEIESGAPPPIDRPTGPRPSARHRLSRLVPPAVHGLRTSGLRRASREALGRLRGRSVLMGQPPGYDWSPVAAALARARGVGYSELGLSTLDERWWTTYYEPRLDGAWKPGGRGLGTGAPAADPTEISDLSEAFDAWLAAGPRIRIEAAGIDVLPPALQHLRGLTTLGPSLVRHADLVAERALDAAAPDLACFWEITSIAPIRLAHQCRRRGIPVVCYQHGGSYGTHRFTQHEVGELSHADELLTYGEGIRFPDAPATAARPVPVGSARVERARSGRRPGRRPAGGAGGPLRVLWIGEMSFGNTVGGGYTMEDTERYLLETRCLRALGEAAGVTCTYRPFPGQGQISGTVRWIERTALPGLGLDAGRPLEAAINASDVVITDTSSGTVWNEAIAMDARVILHCDPEKIALLPDYEADLREACRWCRTARELEADVEVLASDPAPLLAALDEIDAGPFLERYVLHRDDGGCVDRALAALGGAVPA